MAYNQNEYLVGTNGDVWMNGKLLGNIKKIEIKITGSFEDINLCGDFSTHNAYVGWAGEGTLTMQKIDSTIMSMMAEAYQTGVMPEIKIITKLTNKASKKSERTAITGVSFTEFMLAAFESKGLIEDEAPFKFDGYDVLEKIE